MVAELTGWERFRAQVAVWIVVHVASRISPLGILALCLDVARDYQARYIESIEPEDEGENADGD